MKHHHIFSKFRRWSGATPAGFDVDFLGTRYRTSYFTMWRPQPNARNEMPSYPSIDEEYLEWIDLVEAVASTESKFTMLELGAGFGRWTARGAAAAEQFNIAYSLVAVEAEPTHYGWMLENLRDNGVKMENCRTIHAAVAGYDGKVGFHVGGAENSYGQAIGGDTEVDAISLQTLLLPFKLVDLIDIDVQGAELGILSAAVEPLSQKVKRVHVETHSNELHADILKLFRGLGWKPRFLFEGHTADQTPWGRINFQEGTQTWLNPRLCNTEQLRNIHLLCNSPIWRTLNWAVKSLTEWRQLAPFAARHLMLPSLASARDIAKILIDLADGRFQLPAYKWSLIFSSPIDSRGQATKFPSKSPRLKSSSSTDPLAESENHAKFLATK